MPQTADDLYTILTGRYRVIPTGYMTRLAAAAATGTTRREISLLHEYTGRVAAFCDRCRTFPGFVEHVRSVRKDPLMDVGAFLDGRKAALLGMQAEAAALVALGRDPNGTDIRAIRAKADGLIAELNR